MFELPGSGVVRVQGADAEKVINNQCTNDIKKLPVGHLCEGFITNVRGWCVEHVFVGKLAGEILLVGQFGNSQFLSNHIERYIVREDACVADLSSQKTLLLLNAEEVSTVANEFGMRSFRPKPGEIHNCSMGDLEMLMLSTSMLQSGDQLMVGNLADRTKVLAMLNSAGIHLETEEQFELRRILSFWPRAGKEILEKSLPQELDRDTSAISFTKGCYLGQETIARLDARGQLQKKLCLLRIDTSSVVAQGVPVLRDEQPVGQITSAAFSESLGYTAAMAYLRRGHTDPGVQLICDGATAEVLSARARS
jgi:tRNA-modifying protein YgfZ